VRLGTNMMVLLPGWGPSDRTPAIAASAAAMVRSWLDRKPLAMREPS